MHIALSADSLMGTRTGACTYGQELIAALLRVDRANTYSILALGSHRYVPEEGSPFRLDRERVTLTAWREPRFLRFMLSQTSLGRIPLVSVLARTVDWRVMRPLLDTISAGRRRAIFRGAVRPVRAIHFLEPVQMPDPHKPTIVTLLDMGPLLFPEHWAPSAVDGMAKAMRAHISRNSHFIAISERTKADFVARFRISPERVRTIYLGVNPRFNPGCGIENGPGVRARHGIGERRYVLCLGRVDWNKNLGNVVRAFNELRRRKRGGDSLLVIAGPGRGSCLDEINRIVDELGIRDDVLVTGYVRDEDVPALMNGATVFVSPSYCEGFGLSVLEAMACGTPVLTSNVSALPEVTGDAAIAVPPDDVPEMAAAMESILCDDRTRREMSERGLKRAQRFSWDDTARQTIQMYEDVVGNGK